MIVPARRLLFLVLLIILPLLAGSAIPGWLLIAVAGAALLLLIAAIADAMRGIQNRKAISVSMPPLVRMQKNREAILELRIRDESATGRELRAGLALPAEFNSPHETLTTRLPRGKTDSHVRWPCTSSSRGRYFLNTVYFEIASPLGLWAIRGKNPAETELRVHPNLFDEQKKVAALFLNRGQFGMHVQRQSGQGREFDKLREYVHGDSFDQIHWKSSAKRNEPVTKVFQIERTQEIYLVLDASRLSTRNQNGDALFERYLTAALITGSAAEQQGDLFGVVAFDDKVRSFVRAGSGKTHFGACRDALYTLEPKLVSPDYDELFSFLRVRLRKRALLLFLTSLDDPVLAENFAKSSALVSRQHLLLVSMIHPPGATRIFQGEEITRPDEIYQQLGGHYLWRRLREMGQVLHRQGVQFSLVENEKLAVELTRQYLTVKARQIL